MNAIIIDEFYPDARRDSGSIDILNYITALKSLGYESTLLTTVSSEADVSHRSDQEFGFRWVPANKIDGWLLDCKGKLEVVFTCRPGPTSAWIRKIRSLAPDAPIIYLTVDLHFLRLEREFEISGVQEKLFEARRYRAIELDCIRQSDLTVVVSSYERNYLYSIDPGLRVKYIPLFRERIGSSIGFDGRSKRAVFIGGYQHLPNIDAVFFLVESIVPHIRNMDPEIEIVLAGSNMPDSVRKLERPGVRAVGQVDSLTEFFDSARVSIAPLRFGAGQKGKVLSSLSHRLPVVCSSVASEGMFDGVEKGVVIANDPVDFAANIVALCNSRNDWNRLSEEADELSCERNTSLLPLCLSELINQALNNKSKVNFSSNGTSPDILLSILMFTRDGFAADRTVMQSWISQVEMSDSTELLILNAGKPLLINKESDRVKEVLGFEDSVDRLKEGLMHAKGKYIRFASDDDAILSNAVSEIEIQALRHQGRDDATIIGDFVLKSNYGVNLCEQNYHYYPRGAESYRVFINSRGAIPSYYSVFPVALVRQWCSYLSNHPVPFSYVDWLLTTLAFARTTVMHPGSGKMVSYYDQSNWHDQASSEIRNLQIMKLNGVPDSILPMINLFWLMDAVLLLNRPAIAGELELKVDLSEIVKRDQLKRFVDNFEFRARIIGRHADKGYIDQIARLSPLFQEVTPNLQSFRDIISDVVTKIEGGIPEALSHYFCPSLIRQ